jgi:hypothetical protein
MWIAKPITALTQEEKGLWRPIEIHLPLSQTLGWAKAIEAMAGKCYLVFSPDEQVGGIVFTDANPLKQGRHFECINGPSLNWDNPKLAPRQLATFATAVSKLDRRFSSLSMKPRWEGRPSIERLKHLPIPIFRESHAATIVIPIRTSTRDQFLSLSARMRRTLSVSRKASIQTEFRIPSPEELTRFVPAMQAFGQKQGFTVPPLSWFEAISKEHECWMITAHAPDGLGNTSRAQILVCRHGQKAHYLFGYESRSPHLRSSISTSALAQWEAISRCSFSGILDYDLNGYIIDVQPENPYYGVCRFKEQFLGSIIEYVIPEFLIQ